jgi:hypothetical protein
MLAAVYAWWGRPVATAAQPPKEPAKSPAPLSDYYGFLPVEIYKLENGISNLLAKDINGDGKTDLAVINNAKARIELLLQRGDAAKVPPAPASSEPNVIASDRRLDLHSIPVSKQLVGLVAGDFNGDGRCDLAYLATPGELATLERDAKGQWSRRGQFPVPDAAKAPWSLDAGDLNGDKLDDIVLLGDNDLYLFYQRKGSGVAAGLAEPVKLPFSQPNMNLVRIVDFDGDGRNDITYSAEGDEDALRVRLQLATGQIGPELRFHVPPVRALTFEDVDGKPGEEFLSIERQSGRVTIQSTERTTDSESPVGPLEFYPLGRSAAGRARGVAIGDFDNDGRADVVVSDPQGAQLVLFKQERGGLGAAQSFPSLANSGELRAIDRPAGTPDELLVLSISEKSIAQSKLDKGRLVFPQPLPVVGEPLAMDVADVDADGRVDVGYVARRRGTAGARDTLVVRWIKQEPNGWRAGAWGTTDEVPLTGTTDPGGLRLADANRDGRTDWIVLNPNGPAQVLLADASRKPVASAAASVGLGSGLAPGALFVGDFDGPALLVAQFNFARQMHVAADGRWQTRDQFNAPNATAKIAAVVPCDVDGDKTPELVLADTAGRGLLIHKRAGAVFQPWKRLHLGTIELKALHAADLNGDGRQDLIVFGSDALAVSYSGSAALRLVERSNYETTIRDAVLADLAAADLNDDGLSDIAMMDTARHFLDIIQVGRDAQIQPALSFQLFESKTVGGRGEGLPEPREILPADVTGDGRADLVFIAHDRVLVYAQDAGK